MEVRGELHGNLRKELFKEGRSQRQTLDKNREAHMADTE